MMTMVIVPMMGWETHTCSNVQTTINTLDVVVEAFQQTREIQRQCKVEQKKMQQLEKKTGNYQLSLELQHLKSCNELKHLIQKTTKM
mgnify:CR=1 FL=1